MLISDFAFFEGSHRPPAGEGTPFPSAARSSGCPSVPPPAPPRNPSREISPCWTSDDGSGADSDRSVGTVHIANSPRTTSKDQSCVEGNVSPYHVQQGLFYSAKWLFARLPHVKCIRLVSVRSSHLPFKMHYVKSPYICILASEKPRPLNISQGDYFKV